MPLGVPMPLLVPRTGFRPQGRRPAVHAGILPAPDGILRS
jgi:hypothetical protein